MAQVPPALLGLPAIVRAPTTYVEKYRANPDALGGMYGPLYTTHLVTSGQTPLHLLSHLLRANETVPKVFLTLVVGPGGDLPVRTLFRIQT